MYETAARCAGLTLTMVCPMCITAVISQAAVPVASVVGGAIAAKAALLKGKQSSGGSITARVLDRNPSQPKIQSIDVDECGPVPAPGRSFNIQDRL